MTQVVKMFRHKLLGLGYSVEQGGFDCTDPEKVKQFIVWLEDQRIQHYKEHDREGIRNIHSPEWEKVLDKYLTDLGGLPSQINRDSLPELVDWLLSIAIQRKYKYSEKAHAYSTASSAKLKEEGSQGPKMVTVNPLDRLDFGSPEFIEGVQKLAEELGVTSHPNHLITLEAISTLVKTRMSSEALKNLDALKPKGMPWPFIDNSMGVETGNETLNQASKILRLLYIHDLKDLQTKINECLVEVQTISADPRIDGRLGELGSF